LTHLMSLALVPKNTHMILHLLILF